MSGQRNQTLYYVLADFLSTNIAVLLFNIFRYYDLEVVNKGFFTLTDFLSSPMLIIGQIIFPLFMMGMYYLSGIYSSEHIRSRTSEFGTTLLTALIGTVTLIFVALINDVTNDRKRDYALFFMLFLLLFAVVYIPRLLLTLHTRRKVRCGKIYYNTLIVGYSSYPQAFLRQRERVEGHNGLRIIGYVDAENRSRFCKGLPEGMLADLIDIHQRCSDLKVERIVVIPHPSGWVTTLGVLDKLFELEVPVYIAAESLPPYVFSPQITGLTAEPFIDISRTHLSPSTLNIKRTFDVMISLLMTAICAIPVGLISVAIMIESKGSPFYLQQRVGRGKRIFNIIKLRTMRTDSEHGEPELSYRGDSRVTGMGRWLRRYHIDELPQFLNVLKGDMSLVGPRPERPHFVELILKENPSYTLIHRVRPGITSLGMIKYGYASTVEDMVKRMNYDLLYLQNISITTDLKIILHTVDNVMGGRGI